jgi:hypothetical protein
MKLKDASLHVLVRNRDGTVNLASPDALLLKNVKQHEANALIAYFNELLTLAKTLEEQCDKARNREAYLGLALEGAHKNLERAMSDADAANKQVNELNRAISQFNTRNP